MSGFLYGRILQEEIQLNPAELAARLQTEKGFSNQKIAACEAELRGALDCRYGAIRVEVSYPKEDTVQFGGILVESHSLFRNLAGCREAFLLAVTIGMGVERLLGRMSLLSGAEHFITDALASAAAEAACDAAEEKIRQGLCCRPRFSPGYGDLPLAIQPQLLELVQGRKLLGITLSNSLLMSPSKSITAIMGICHEEYEK